MLDYDDQQRDLARAHDTPLGTRFAASLSWTDIGAALGLSESQVLTRLSYARTARSRTPLVWMSFREGSIDEPRVREIASTVDRLTEPESVALLDRTVVSYASDHTLAELKRWLRRFVERHEAEAAGARSDEAVRHRYVKVDHVDDSMAYLTAYLPSHVAAAIERRLHKEARRITHDPRTLAQRQADLVASWLITNEAGVAAPDAHVAVKVDADVLAGACHGFAESADGAWSVPADWVLALAETSNLFWHRMVLDPVTDDVLSHEYRGRFAPKVLAKALEFRDGTCSVPGCLVPAWQCEIDHLIPWPRGSTTAANLGLKSKRHHDQKSHGLIPA